MTLLKEIKSGWKWLADRFNEVINGINARTIIVPLGGGLDIQETSNGTLLALTSSGVLAKPGTTTKTAGDPYTPPNNLVPQWQLINVVIETDTGYTTKQTYVWSTPLQ